MVGSTYDFYSFKLPPYLKHKNLEKYITIYICEDLYLKVGAWCFLCHFNSHVCYQENWFQNQSTESFFINNHWTPTISISQINIHEVRNILLEINGHRRTSRIEYIGLGSWVKGPKTPPGGPKYSKKTP